jgi:hypothetical protein
MGSPSKKSTRGAQSNREEAISSLLSRLAVDGPSTMESDEKLIIALDFGTTFSGIAYCFANQRDTKVAAIVDWPGE